MTILPIAWIGITSFPQKSLQITFTGFMMQFAILAIDYILRKKYLMDSLLSRPYTEAFLTPSGTLGGSKHTQRLFWNHLSTNLLDKICFL
jgi:hypothetical protein